ncbi:hemolysin III family protein [Cohnella lubricantis]|uniref:Hemolysin III family protein n=1 Tax=Cohnella lubricantis TaxID=2163172 RepID=A0A841TBP4_9BACL|nr:hemolysin III family protein [Cohnella lubricantis]MBB6678893.1 hemolysin III family protein [Cohnella lubricantis]MBP2120218.1 hemolysin III [Cohnella lubricantis]
MAHTYVYSRKEEVANAVTHGIGAVLSIAALTLLIIFASLNGTAWHVTSFAVYGVTMLMLYTASTLVHSFREGKVKDLFETFDHSCIYLYIAGTYTPLMLTVLRSPLGWTVFGIVWGIAIGGVVFKAFFTKRFLFLSTLFYLLMGWMVVLVWGPLKEAMPAGGMHLLMAGGMLYTLGSVFYVWRAFRYHHAVWHLFVLGGSVLHFFTILLYVL